MTVTAIEPTTTFCQDPIHHENGQTTIGGTEHFEMAPTERGQFDRTSNSIQIVHRTSEGNVHLWLRKAGNQYYVASIEGCEVDSAYVVDSMEDGFRQTIARFRALFPEHRCSVGCSMPHAGSSTM
jgi:hypothetical protein